jgi:hypothetical protein
LTNRARLLVVLVVLMLLIIAAATAYIFRCTLAAIEYKNFRPTIERLSNGMHAAAETTFERPACSFRTVISGEKKYPKKKTLKS